MVITFSSIGMNCVRYFRSSVLPAPGVPQNTRFIFALMQFFKNARIGFVKYPCFSISSSWRRITAGVFRIDMEYPVSVTDGWMIEIRRVSVSASSTLLNLFSCSDTTLEIWTLNCWTNSGVNWTSALYRPFSRCSSHTSDPL